MIFSFLVIYQKIDRQKSVNFIFNDLLIFDIKLNYDGYRYISEIRPDPKFQDVYTSMCFIISDTYVISV